MFLPRYDIPRIAAKTRYPGARTKDYPVSKPVVFFFVCPPVLSLPSESTLGALHTQH